VQTEGVTDYEGDCRPFGALQALQLEKSNKESNMSGKASEEITVTKEEIEIGKSLISEMEKISDRIAEFSQGVLNRHLAQKGSQQKPVTRARLPIVLSKDCDENGICYCMSRNERGEPTFKLC
jgi:hypothetical protein